MMDIFEDNLIKSPGVYRCPDNIKNFKVRIKIKKIQENPTKNESDKWLETKLFWQEKRFSKFHREFYADEKNLVTDLEKEYHKRVTAMENHQEDFVFSYTNEDPIFEINNKEVTNSLNSSPNYLQKTLKIGENSEGGISQRNSNYFDFQKDLMKSIENTVFFEQLEKMIILVDLGEYIQNIWVQNEQPLCQILYNKSTKCLKITPDFTTTHPYILKIAKNEEEIKYCYFLDNCSKEIQEGIYMNEKNLINKLNSLKVSLRIPSLSPFQVPPKNKLLVFLFFEISSGKNFESSDVYLEYFIDLPRRWSCQGGLTGRTQLCKGGGKETLVHFGHLFDVVLEYDLQDLQKYQLPKSPYIYFEVISKDSWERHRTEGLAYQILPIFNSGRFEYSLHCFRFSKNFFGELRRSFIGDYRNFDELSWIGVPQNHEGTILNKFGTKIVSTGQLNIKINVVHQCQAFLEKFNDSQAEQNPKERLVFEKLRSSTLIKSVEEVLRAFKKARRTMLEAKIAKNVE